MSDFGGEMRFSMNGTPVVVRGNVSLMPSSVEVEGIINQDNSVSRAFKPVAFEGEVSFEDAAGLDWDAIMKQSAQRMSIIEDQVGTVHVFSGAVFTGRPSVNRLNGEVTGLKILAQQYRKTAA